MNREKCSVCFVGPYGAGKTSLMDRLASDTFEEGSRPTIGGTLSVIDINGLTYVFKDTAGQERYASIIPMMMRGTDVFVVCIEATSQETSALNYIDKYMELIYDAQDTPLVIIALTKCDLVSEPPKWSMTAFRSAVMAMETSAKTGYNAATLLSAIRALYEARKDVVTEEGQQPLEKARAGKKGCC